MSDHIADAGTKVLHEWPDDLPSGSIWSWSAIGWQSGDQRGDTPIARIVTARDGRMITDDGDSWYHFDWQDGDTITRIDVIQDPIEAQLVHDVLTELARADVKHGRGEGIPDVVKIEKPNEFTPSIIAVHYQIPTVMRARGRYESAKENEALTHAHILIEEVAEYVHAAAMGDDAATYAEACQVAAMGIKAMREIRRRNR